MSATIGIFISLTILASEAVDSSSGHETLTISAPASSKSFICLIVPLTSVVKVLVIDCTDIGASPPTRTLPTFICLDFLLEIFLKGLISLIYLTQKLDE